MEKFDFKKINTKPLEKKKEAQPISGKEERISATKFSGYEKIIHEGVKDLIELYENNKKLFHDGGSMARIYELPYDNTTLVIKEIRNSSEIKNGFIINGPEEELDIQDQLYDIGIKVPIPVSFIKVSGIDFKQKKSINRELIIMEKVSGMSIGDIQRKIDEGGTSPLPDDFSVEKFMNKLEVEVDKMHKNNYFHRDLTVNNVMINDENEPVIIDFGASVNSFESDPYELYSTVMIKNGQRVHVQGSPRLIEDEKSLRSIKEVLKKIVQ